MKTLLKVAALVCLLVSFAYGAPTWTTISSVATNCPTAAKWYDWTDFVPDFDTTPDGYLYLKLYYETGVPWDYNSSAFPGQTAEGYTYIFRVQPNLAVKDYYSQWQQLLRFTAGKQAVDRVSLCKRNGTFIGPNFYEMQSVGGSFDWSLFSWWATNALGVPAIPGLNYNVRPNAWRPNNSFPYAAGNVCGFSTFAGITNSKVLVSMFASGNDNLQLRKATGQSYTTFAGASYSTLVSKLTDSQYKTTRGITFNGNSYIWKGPTSSTTADGIWVVTNVVGNTAVAECVTNAYNLVPVTTMETGADSWHNAEACGIVAFAPSENALGKDLVVVSANVGGGRILAFDLANPLAGPVTLWGVSNIFPTGATSTLLQLGKAGRFLFVVKGDTAANRVMYRLDMLGLSATEPFVDITNANASVNSTVTDFTVTGTNAGEVVGMWYENALNSATGPITPGADWSVSVPLAVGYNTITVKGTNTIGIMSVDSCLIGRLNPGQGEPVVTIGNGNALVYTPDTSYNLSGTANAEVYGKMWWANTTTAQGGSIDRATSWTMLINSLATGDNTIVVYGTNLYNVTASATTTISLGLNYSLVLGTKVNVGLPIGTGSRDLNTSISCESNYLYFSLCSSEAPLSRIDYEAVNNTAWDSTLAPFPTIVDSWDSGAKGFGYYNGGLYQFARLYGGARAVVKYDINLNVWNLGAEATGDAADGVNTACVLDDLGNIYGAWRGWNAIQKISNWATFGCAWGANPKVNLSGAGGFAWSTTRDAAKIYILSEPGKISSIPADGSADGTFTFEWNTPWTLGDGCSIEYVPGTIAKSGHNELWVLRGNGSGDLAIYDMDLAVWTKILLTDTFDWGSIMKMARGNMYFVRGGTDGDEDQSNMSRMIMVPEPASAVLALCGLLLLRRRR